MMPRQHIVLAAAFAAASVTASAAPQRPRPARRPVTRITTESQCPTPLGRGVKSRRQFCDVAVTTDPAKGIVMRLPPHTGASTLRFDLHNRFSVSGRNLSFARASALVAVLNANGGARISRAAVLSELRTETDLFDRLTGTGPGGTKTVAPGRAENVTVPLPATVSAISIVGIRVEFTSQSGIETFDSPGRPVAIVSNLRLEYTPAAVGR